jgi:hypothetical protein
VILCKISSLYLGLGAKGKLQYKKFAWPWKKCSRSNQIKVNNSKRAQMYDKPIMIFHHYKFLYFRKIWKKNMQ